MFRRFHEEGVSQDGHEKGGSCVCVAVDALELWNKGGVEVGVMGGEDYGGVVGWDGLYDIT